MLKQKRSPQPLPAKEALQTFLPLLMILPSPPSPKGINNEDSLIVKEGLQRFCPPPNHDFAERPLPPPNGINNEDSLIVTLILN